MRLYKATLLILVLSAGLWACRYDEGPVFSFKSPEKRLANTWRFITFQEGNVNRTPEYVDSLIEFKDNHAALICDFEANCREGRWDLIRDKKELQLIFGSRAQTFRILRLKQNEIWLESIDQGFTRWELRPL